MQSQQVITINNFDNNAMNHNKYKCKRQEISFKTYD